MLELGLYLSYYDDSCLLIQLNRSHRYALAQQRLLALYRQNLTWTGGDTDG